MTNQFGGRCDGCGGHVAAGTGQRIDRGNGWQTYHNRCVPVGKAPAVGTRWGQRRTPLMAFDVEAALAKPLRARIISAALVFPDGSRRTWLVDPGVPVPPGTARPHGSTDARTRDNGVSPPVALAEIGSLIADQFANRTPLVAFWASYDVTTLHTALARHGLDGINWSDVVVIGHGVADDPDERQRLASKKLGDLCRYYEVELTQPQGALADTLAALELAQSIAAQHERFAQMPLDRLPENRVKWRFGPAPGTPVNW